MKIADQRVQALVRDADETLRRSFGAAGVAIDLDESVRKIDGLVVLHPVDTERNPVLGVAGLVVAIFGVLSLGGERSGRREEANQLRNQVVGQGHQISVLQAENTALAKRLAAMPTRVATFTVTTLREKVSASRSVVGPKYFSS